MPLGRRVVEMVWTCVGKTLSVMGRADPGLLLKPESVGWLRRNLLGAVTAWDLARTYTFSNVLISGRSLVAQWVDEGPDSHAFRWHLRYYNDADRAVPLSLDPIARSIVLDWDLFGSEGTGVVAFNDRLVLESYRAADGSRRNAWGHGIGPMTYARELALYKRWGAREIHLYAVRHGRTKWIKLDFVPQDLGSVAEKYDEWARANGVREPLPADPKRYPVGFLESLPLLPLYKVIQ